MVHIPYFPNIQFPIVLLLSQESLNIIRKIYAFIKIKFVG